MGTIRTQIKKALFFFGDLSLQKQLILAYLAIILIPIMIFSVIFYNSFNERTIRDLIRSSEFVLALEEANIRNNMELMERTAQLTVSSTELVEYLHSEREPDARQLVDFNRNTYSSLQKLLFNNPNIANIRLFSGNRNVLEIWPSIFKESRIANKAWYPEVLKRSGAVLWEINRTEDDPIRANTAGSHSELTTYVSLLRGLQDAGRHAGILEVDMKLEQFFTRTFGAVQENQSQMVVIDRKGELYHGGGASGEGETVVDRETILRQMDAHKEGGGNSFQFEYGNRPYLGTWKRVDRLDAYLLNMVSLQKPLSEIRQTRNNLIAVAAVLIVILSVITYLLQALILKKLQLLKHSMKKVRQGDFHIDMRIGSKGEVGELALHFRKLVSTINELIADAVNKQAATKEAELNSLKNQINSHFLYNTLENLKMLAEIEGQYTISDALTSLGGMMRYSMRWDGNQVRLSEEIAHIKNYISIMNIRYDNRLELKVEVPPEYMGQEVPKMSLQPVVENALQHGMRPRGERMTVTIRASSAPGMMRIEVWDDGMGMSQGRVEELRAKLGMEDADFQALYGGGSMQDGRGTGRGGGGSGGGGGGSGIGLRNVNQRIMMYCGGEYGLFVDSAEDAWTCVTMKLPYYILSKEG